MESHLPMIWAAVIGVAVALYVILDGFDLGIGILFPSTHSEEEREQMLGSIGPFWDGNETWLVLGGGGLWVAFPRAYAIIMPALYLPVIVMLLALVFRGVAFEFHSVSRSKTFWNGAFACGSTLAAFCQGVMLGAFIQGFEVEGRHFTGTALDFLTPFSVLTGIALLFGYSLLGAGWLILKTEGEIQATARRHGKVCLLGVLIAIAIVSAWTPIMSEDVAVRWFSWPNIAFLSPVPIATGLTALAVWRALNNRSEAGAFIGAIILFTLAYVGMAISLWPMIVPHHYTLWEAASSERTQAFLLIGTLFLLPVIFAYTGWSYWVFRGKVRGDVGYH